MTTKFDVLLSKLSNPARRAIQSTGATTIEDLASYTKMEIANLHGIGPNALQSISEIMHEHGLTFKGQ